MEKSKNANRSTLADPTLSGRAVPSEAGEETGQSPAAVLLCQTLALGIIRYRYAHLLEPGVTASLGERRRILDLLLSMTDPVTVDLAGRDHVIDLAIRRGRT
jgi:hypothetical protein